jgi:hypothetical protein
MPSTASRLSAEMQISTSLVSLASAILFGVNWRNLSCVSSIAWDRIREDMHEAVLSQIYEAVGAKKNEQFIMAPAC